jgi:hypothetical protein
LHTAPAPSEEHWLVLVQGEPSATSQVPAAEHWSEPAQAEQVAPLFPHWVLVPLPRATQVVPAQQPVQLDGPQVAGGVQVPSSQVSPEAHWMHVPTSPHARGLCSKMLTQTLPKQHPKRQVLVSQDPASEGAAQMPL